MNKALRRWQQQVAKARHRRILINCYGWKYWAEPRQWRTTGWRHHWVPVSDQIMNEPGYWIHQMMERPARGRTSQLLTLVKNGRDPDSINWPSHKKPHIYYW